MSQHDGITDAKRTTGAGARLLLSAAAVAVMVALPVGLAIHSVRDARLAVDDTVTGTLADAATVFDRIGYNTDDHDGPGHVIPRVMLTELPRELPHISDTTQRKALFLTTVLPHILKVNEIIRAERETLLDLVARQNAGVDLVDGERQWLIALATKYRTDEDAIDVLVRRVNVIPPSLALAQAAIESGWGTSRFAQKGNAIYGQWTWGEDGMVPLGRPEGQRYRIRTFGHLVESVAAYARNLNTHQAYTDLRQMRAELVRSGSPLTGPALTPALEQYSTRRGEYVTDVDQIIRTNRLTRFDQMSLQYSALDGGGISSTESATLY
ncbi:MAG: glucosaminidase domain-containing protein [Sphingomonadales bacterium]